MAKVLSRQYLNNCHKAIEFADTGCVYLTEAAEYGSLGDYLNYLSLEAAKGERDIRKFTSILLILAAEEELDGYPMEAV